MGRDNVGQGGSQQDDSQSDGESSTETAAGWIDVEMVKESQDRDDIRFA